MPSTLADAQNLLSDLIARYCERVDYLMIRLEEAEGTDILLRGDKVETSVKVSPLVDIFALVIRVGGVKLLQPTGNNSGSDRRSDRCGANGW